MLFLLLVWEVWVCVKVMGIYGSDMINIVFKEDVVYK